MKKILIPVVWAFSACPVYAQAANSRLDHIYTAAFASIKALVPAGSPWIVRAEPGTHTIILSSADTVLLCTASALFHTGRAPDTSTVRAVWETRYILAPEFTEQDSLAMVAFNDSLAQMDHDEERAAAYATNDPAVIASMENKLLDEMKAAILARKDLPEIEGKDYCVFMPPPAVITQYGLFDICDDQLYRSRMQLADNIYRVLEHAGAESEK